MLLLTSFLMTLWFLHGARSDPGYIHRHSRTHDRGEPMLQDKEITWIDSRPIIGQYSVYMFFQYFKTFIGTLFHLNFYHFYKVVSFNLGINIRYE